MFLYFTILLRFSILSYYGIPSLIIGEICADVDTVFALLIIGEICADVDTVFALFIIGEICADD